MKLPEKFKIFVKSPEHSKNVQDHLFSLGYKWKSGDKEYISLPESYHCIYVNDYGKNELTYGSGSLNYPEFELIEKISFDLKDKKEVVKIGEKSYYMSDLEIALSNIKPIEE